MCLTLTEEGKKWVEQVKKKNIITAYKVVSYLSETRTLMSPITCCMKWKLNKVNVDPKGIKRVRSYTAKQTNSLIDGLHLCRTREEARKLKRLYQERMSSWYVHQYKILKCIVNTKDILGARRNGPYKSLVVTKCTPIEIVR